ncbi:DHHC palmitoyltransferase-domain-containing protein [Chlamydoabsidia padenii]|nr:DHHC palmitoyltransferase-domain-containing protein [Chlamydoabsidia padenii]
MEYRSFGTLETNDNEVTQGTGFQFFRTTPRPLSSSLEQFDLDSPPPTHPLPTSSGITHTSASGLVNEKKSQRQRNYQQFPGKSTFFCGGRLMTSQAHWAFFIALFLVVVPSVLFGIFTCPFLWFNIHPVVPIMFGYMFLIALGSLFKTSWTDPGVIPRGLDPTPTLETFDDQSSIWTQPFPADRCVKINDVMWNLKYCGTCKIYRPPRASHCRQCDNCVENEDHHCIWLNNCIGKRNYRPFFTFIIFCTLMAIYLIVFCILHLFMAAQQIRQDINFDLIFQTTPVSFVLAIVGFILLWMVGGLTVYHCYLIYKGMTTHEKLRSTMFLDGNPHIQHPNPYDKKKPLKNIIQVLCRPQTKSHLRRRKYTDAI